MMSLPVWGAWIEIQVEGVNKDTNRSLPVWGAWIEIFMRSYTAQDTKSRSLYGERGLKSAG